MRDKDQGSPMVVLVLNPSTWEARVYDQLGLHRETLSHKRGEGGGERKRESKRQLFCFVPYTTKKEKYAIL